MATVTSSLKYGFSGMMSNRFLWAENTIDFSVTNRDADDIIQLFEIPAKHMVIKLGYDVMTVEGGTLTFDVGDSVNGADYYLDGINGNSQASAAVVLQLVEATPNTILENTNGQYYSAADTIDLTIKNDADAAKIRIWAAVLNCAPAYDGS